MSVGGMRGTEMLDVIEALKSAAAAATPGPWWSEGSNIYHDGRYLQCCGRGTIHGCCGDPEVAGHEQESVASAEEKDAEFIALARTAVPALIARLEASEARNATAYAEGVEAAMQKTVDAAIEQADMRDEVADDTNDWQVYNHAAFKLTTLVSAIRSLLKDKPNEKTRQIAPPGQSTGE